MKPLKHIFYITTVYLIIVFLACNREKSHIVKLPKAVYITYVDENGSNNFILSDIQWDNYSPNKYVLNISLKNLPLKLNYSKLEHAYLMKKIDDENFSKVALDENVFDFEFKSDQLSVFYNKQYDDKLPTADVLGFEVKP